MQYKFKLEKEIKFTIKKKKHTKKLSFNFMTNCTTNNSQIIKSYIKIYSFLFWNFFLSLVTKAVFWVHVWTIATVVQVKNTNHLNVLSCNTLGYLDTFLSITFLYSLKWTNLKKYYHHLYFTSKFYQIKNSSSKLIYSGLLFRK